MSPQLDDHDQRIVDHLRLDGRLSNREVARRVGLSEGAVRARLKRLRSQNVLRITALRSLATVPDAALLFVGITVDRPRVREVAAALQTIPEVHYAAIVLGDFDIIVTLVLEDRSQLYYLLSQRMATIPGVIRTETMEALMTVKTFSHQAVIL